MTATQPSWKYKTNPNEDLGYLSLDKLKKLCKKYHLDSEKLKELCFALFSGYYINSRMRRYEQEFSYKILKELDKLKSKKEIDIKKIFRIKKGEELYCFVGDSNKSFLVGKFGSEKDIGFKSLLDKDFFNKFSRGNDKTPELCTAKHFLLYNISRALEEEDSQLHEFIQNNKFPECKSKSCVPCIKKMKKLAIDFLKKKYPEHLFGGKVIEINLPLSIINMFVQENSEYYEENKGLEKAFCGILAYILSKGGINFTANDIFSSPHFCNEVDLFLYNKEKNLIIEFTMQDEVTTKYIQDKIYNHYLIKQQLSIDNLKSIVVFMNKNSLIQQNVEKIKSEIKDHLDYFEEDFLIMGYNDILPKLNDEEYFAQGFAKLRDIFNSLLNKLTEETEKYFKPENKDLPKELF